MTESQRPIKISNEIKNVLAVFELIHKIENPEKYQEEDYQQSFTLEFYLEGDSAKFYNEPKPITIFLTKKPESISKALVPEISLSSESNNSLVRKTTINLKCSEGGLALFGLALPERITSDTLNFENILSNTRSK